MFSNISRRSYYKSITLIRISSGNSADRVLLLTVNHCHQIASDINRTQQNSVELFQPLETNLLPTNIFGTSCYRWPILSKLLSKYSDDLTEVFPEINIFYISYHKLNILKRVLSKYFGDLNKFSDCQTIAEYHMTYQLC